MKAISRAIAFLRLVPRRREGRREPRSRPIGNGNGAILDDTSRVSIELSNLCNYASWHKKCPLHNIRDPVILPARIVRSVLSTLGEYNFQGVIAFHTYNEPLIDPRLFQFIDTARRECPRSSVHICSNGFYLTQTLAEELVAVGTASIRVSAYTRDEEERLSKIRVRIPYVVAFTKLDDRLALYDRPEKQSCKPCGAPLNEIIVGCDGRISLCCLDWRRDHSFGDLHVQAFEDILRSGELQRVYERLSKGDRFLPLCKRCDWTR